VVDLGGAVTVVALVGLGLFGYPWLLRRGVVGRIALALTSTLLVALYYGFDGGRSAPAVALAFALAWAALPLVAGLVTVRVNRNRS